MDRPRRILRAEPGGPNHLTNPRQHHATLPDRAGDHLLMRCKFLPFTLLLACTGGVVPDPPEVVDTAPEPEPPTPSAAWSQEVLVTLDGQPTAEIVVMQGGTQQHLRTDASGRATLLIDPSVEGDLAVVAAHPEARTAGTDAHYPVDLITVELTRFSAADNPDYVFQDPGTPTRNNNTGYCSHCHVRQVEDWVEHPHGQAAKDPVVHDVYAGTASQRDEDSCIEAGGSWQSTRAPGGGRHETCVLGHGTLPDLNPECGAPCDTPTATGACADCHAPGIDGELGGRDLLQAVGISYEHGVHCDVCHKVADIDLAAPPGVGGRLKIIRPTEPSTSAGFDQAPLTFSPLFDVLNPRMGAAWSPVFREARFCAGCHEHDQEVLVPGQQADPTRWPSGKLPIQSTFSEWEQGPLADVAPCQSCHMPPDAEAGNSADIDLLTTQDAGRVAGWWRPAGASRRHSWTGPRSDEVDLVKLALTLELVTTSEEGVVHASTTVRHQGPGHAVPTGEPLRQVVLRLEASCDGDPLAATSGPAIPTFVGAVATKATGEDWSTWPQAVAGQTIRVVRNDGWVDYDGFGPFGDGTFDVPAKGLPDLQVVGSAKILAVDEAGVVTLDQPLPAGDLALLGASPAAGPTPLAGAPGFAFARVLVDAEGREGVPHHRATDVRSDNRLLPGSAWTTEHRFPTHCAQPVVTATLTYRAYPWWLSAERAWDDLDRVIAEVRR